MEDDTPTPTRWTRDEVASFWPCAPSSVSALSGRHGFPSVGRDPKTRQALYDPAAVAFARYGTPGQGKRTDIRDNSLATSSDASPYYNVGRVIAACEIAHQRTTARRADPEGAAARIDVFNGYLPKALWLRVNVEFHKDRSGLSEPLASLVTDVTDRWMVVAAEFAAQGRRPNLDEQSHFVLGYHHQRSLITDVLKASKSKERNR